MHSPVELPFSRAKPSGAGSLWCCLLDTHTAMLLMMVSCLIFMLPLLQLLRNSCHHTSTGNKVTGRKLTAAVVIQVLHCCNSVGTSPTLMQSASRGPFRAGQLHLPPAQAGLALSVTAMVKSPACMSQINCLARPWLGPCLVTAVCLSCSSRKLQLLQWHSAHHVQA